MLCDSTVGFTPPSSYVHAHDKYRWPRYLLCRPLCTSHLKPRTPPPPPPPIRDWAGHSLFMQVKVSEVPGPWGQQWVMLFPALTVPHRHRVRSFAVIRVRISDPRSVWIMVHQRNRRVRSFGVIRVRITDPRSVWIMGHQRNRRIHSGHGFAGSFDAPWSRQILDHWSELGSPQRNALAGSFDVPRSRQILDHWPNSDHPKERTHSTPIVCKTTLLLPSVTQGLKDIVASHEVKTLIFELPANKLQRLLNAKWMSKNY